MKGHSTIMDLQKTHGSSLYGETWHIQMEGTVSFQVDENFQAVWISQSQCCQRPPQLQSKARVQKKLLIQKTYMEEN